jgi:glycosyltransferase involved in cell wall biosynthesis
LVPLKRLGLLLDAIAKLDRDGFGLRLLIVGDGPERSPLEARARQLGLRAIFTGHRTDVADLLAAMDIFAFCSQSEGQPNAILEAMAAGLPVVAVRIPGLDEIVIHGETGELTDHGAAALASGLRKLAVDRERAFRLGCAGRARADLVFSPSRMVRNFEAIYERALTAHAA